MTNDLTKPEAESRTDANGATQRRLRSVLVLAMVIAAIAATVFTVTQLQVSDPYMETVLTLNGDPVQGHAIFQMNCAGCHGVKNGRQVGPSLTGVSQRKSRVSIIHQVISGETPPMPQFQPKPQEMADLLEYLQTL
ncbi:c-type cytochrome [Phormidium sp. CCY1219]|uniref:c-type cytochrome n=1 Tax=Phormidium sp. CCY1219 TaxID=2886104 RepID=UPI003FA7514A